MKKRLLALLLVIASLFALIPATASADSRLVTEVNIRDLKRPTAGRTLDTTLSVSGTPYSGIYSSGDLAPMVSWLYYDEYEDDWIAVDDPDDYICSDGEAYSALVFIVANDGYDFSSEDEVFSGTVYVNGTEVYCDTLVSDGILVVQLVYYSYPSDPAYLVGDFSIDNVSCAYAVGDRVANFTPGTFSGEGKNCDIIWWIVKLNSSNSPKGIYYPSKFSAGDIAPYMHCSAATIENQRASFGTTFQSGYKYCFFAAQVLKEGYAYAEGQHKVNIRARRDLVNVKYADSVDYYTGDRDVPMYDLIFTLVLAKHSVTTPCAPNVSISKSAGKVKLSWSGVPGADKYWIYRSTDGVNYKYYDSTTSTGYTNGSVTSGTKYYYKVKAVNTRNGKDYASSYSSAKSTVPMATPTLSAKLSSGKVALSWDKVTGATKYNIYRSTDGGKTYKLYDSTTKTSYTNSSVTAGKTYCYKIKAVKTVNGSDWVSDYSKVKKITVLGTPTLSITKTDTKVNLSWSKVSGAAKYQIYRSTDGGKSYKLYDTTTKLSYATGKCTSGTKYYFKVRAVDANGCAGAFSSAKSTVFVTSPVVSAKLQANGCRLSWDKVSGATKYNIYRSTDGENFSLYASTTKLNYVDTKISPDRIYFYRVKACAVVNGGNWLSASPDILVLFS